MKGRSQRMPVAAAADPPDDWGDGSWTVDCSCGVTFDDGEEMVSCDECGVWVHTRCSRFVKGAASFACHNCKASAAEEETEVARLLVELPTKADSCPPPPPPPPRRPPFRLWAQVPLEERVHVQGPPGGDPALFAGLSSVFSSDLWRCTGYVPQKFGFRYREFPCWDEDEEEAGENPASRGADVLFSLSKEIAPYAPTVGALARCDRAKGEKVSSSARSMRSGKKERNRLRAFGVTSGKRKKEESGEGKERIVKKKARSDADRATADCKRRGSVPLTDVNKTNFLEDEHHQIAESVVPNLKSKDSREDMTSVPNSATPTEGTYDGEKNKEQQGVNTSLEGLPEHVPRQKSLFETPMIVEKFDQVEPSRAGVSSKTDSPSYRVGSDVAKESLTKEVVSKVVHLKQHKEESQFARGPNEGSCSVLLVSDKSKPAISDVGNSFAAAFDSAMLPDSKCAILPCSKLDNIEVKVAGGDVQSSRSLDFPSCPFPDGKLPNTDTLDNRQQLICQFSEILQDPKSVSALPSGQPNCEDANTQSQVSYQHCIEDRPSRIDVPKQLGLKVDESAGSSTIQKVPLELGYNSKDEDDLMKKESQNRNHSAHNIRKLVLGAGKAPTSSAPVISRSSVSGIYKSLGTMASSAAGKAINLIKQQQAKATTCPVSKTDSMATNASAEESTQEVSRQIAKCHSKGSICSGSKTSQISGTFQVSSSKPTSSDSNEPQLCPSSKAFTTDDTTAMLDSRDMSGLSQTQIASIQFNAVSSNSSHKNEKIHQPIPQPVSKVFNSSMPTHLPASVTATAALSDEELALLLHQELNSSPRVPRVPRMRQAAGMQLAPPTASMLSKRTSGYGSKDQASVLKRKNKEDTSRESFRSSRDLNDEIRRMGKAPSSADQKHKSDSSAKETEIASGLSSSDATGPGSLSKRSSPRDAQNDIGGRIPRTLPGLIDEIMSRDRHITYEQLCVAVRPHWNDLRKPNGERYAYPSHLHAVHDCLRNRSEWAHLIDQCPKNNSSKKRRKFDADTTIVESEIEKGKNKRSREAEDKNVESHREDFPKGKRKARKRRRLELRGRGVKEARKRRNQVVASDEDPAAFSNISNEGNENHFSEDDSQGTGPFAVGTDLSSSSSDDTD